MSDSKCDLLMAAVSLLQQRIAELERRIGENDAASKRRTRNVVAGLNNMEGRIDSLVEDWWSRIEPHMPPPRMPGIKKTHKLVKFVRLGDEPYEFRPPEDPWAPDALETIRAQLGEADTPSESADYMAQQMLDALRANYEQEKDGEE